MVRFVRFLPRRGTPSPQRQKASPRRAGLSRRESKEPKKKQVYKFSAPMQLVTPSVVMMAVRMLMISWMINFQVSLFMGSKSKLVNSKFKTEI